MKHIIYHAISPAGYKVDIMTNGEEDKITYEELFADEFARIMAIEKTGAKVLKDVPQAPQVVPQATTAPQAIPVCGIHNIPMTWKTGVSEASGKPYAFWSCALKMQDGSWCTYKVPKT